MEPAKKHRKYMDDDIFYSDSEAEQDLNGTLEKVVEKSKQPSKWDTPLEFMMPSPASWNGRRPSKEHLRGLWIPIYNYLYQKFI
jgi:hypothetical protein